MAEYFIAVANAAAARVYRAACSRALELYDLTENKSEAQRQYNAAVDSALRAFETALARPPS